MRKKLLLLKRVIEGDKLCGTIVIIADNMGYNNAIHSQNKFVPTIIVVKKDA